MELLMTKTCFILGIIIFSGSKRDEIDSMMRCHKCWAGGGGRRLGGGSLALQGNCSESRAQPRSDIRIFWPLQNTSDGQATANATLNTKTSRSDNIFLYERNRNVHNHCRYCIRSLQCNISSNLHITHSCMGDSMRITFPFSTLKIFVDMTSKQQIG